MERAEDPTPLISPVAVVPKANGDISLGGNIRISSLTEQEVCMGES